MNNIFTSIPDNLPAELFETLASSETIKIERIVSRGHITPEGEWYDQEWHEWVVLLEGEARLDFADQDEELLVSQGDYVLIPAHQKHRVVFTSKNEDTIWLAVHFKGEITS
ncbi:MAG: Unknown protein [uncultured Thiotrichaceae bacterium]|uniref:Cupin type-2 domain-containing protein n=1 Tax=uncultured Thiotrichaceae bacterium TaxID=298394 RepID=A0A6S6UFP1_9GAMM|nr:MAG: Unknown protein [uncultured Thiotrichaceae bacterium]